MVKKLLARLNYPCCAKTSGYLHRYHIRVFCHHKWYQVSPLPYQFILLVRGVVSVIWRLACLVNMIVYKGFLLGSGKRG